MALRGIGRVEIGVLEEGWKMEGMRGVGSDWIVWKKKRKKIVQGDLVFLEKHAH